MPQDEREEATDQGATAWAVGFGRPRPSRCIHAAPSRVAAVSLVTLLGLTVYTRAHSGDAIPRQAFEHVAPSIYEIYTGASWNGGRYARSGSGSGIGIGSDGWILTAAHVIRGERNVVVVTPDGAGYDADVWRWSNLIDVGVVHVPDLVVAAAQRGDDRTLRIGDRAFLIGHPAGVLSLHDGVISGLHRSPTIDGKTTEQVQGYVQISAQANRGNSGGALVDVRGRVVRLLVERLPDHLAFSFAVPIHAAENVARRLIDDAPALLATVRGVQLRDCSGVPRRLVDELRLRSDACVIVIEVAAGTAAAAAGLRPSDVILAMNGRKVINLAQLGLEVALEVPGATATFVVSTAGVVREIEIELDQLERSCTTEWRRARAVRA